MKMLFKGFIFDLDGTLVDSKLNFEKLRFELDIKPNAPILEEIQTWSIEKQQWAHSIINAHELSGAEISELYPGVRDFLQLLTVAQIPSAIFTRNSKMATELTLNKHSLIFKEVITRNDAPPKPHPAGLLQIAKNFRLANHEILYVGDYLYDLKAGLAAQMPTALYIPKACADFETAGAHFIFSDFNELYQYVDDVL